MIGDTYVSSDDITVGDTPGVLIQGNEIGTNAAGTAALTGNGNGNGIYIDDSDGFQIGGAAAGAGNLISGNSYWAIRVLDTTGGAIEGNDIGTDKSGLLAVPNDLNPVSPAAVILSSGVSDVTIGGTTAAARNVISGNDEDGILIGSIDRNLGVYGNALAAGVDQDNMVEGNYIGLKADGSGALPNVGDGIDVTTSAVGTVIGGTAPGEANVISGNGASGVVIDGTGLPGLTLLYLKADGNTNNASDYYVISPQNITTFGGVTYGTGVTGQAFQFNDTPGERVVVSDTGYLAASALTLSAWINLSRLPGVTPFVIASRVYSATSENYGLYVNSGGELVFEWYSAGAFHTETSSGAALGSRLGVFQQVAVVTDGSIVTFYVNGAAVSSSAMPDPLDATTSGNLEIGGLSQGPNLFNGLIDEFSVTTDALPADEIARIYANAGQGTDLGGSGTQDTTVAGNFIGTNPAGTAAIANGGDGVEIDGAFSNTIGGAAAGAANVISGNTSDGVEITGSGSTGDVVAGNFIGTDVTGSAALGNDNGGVEIDTGASDNLIGGTTASARNIISANDGAGVEIDVANDNLVEGNYVGTDKTGTVGLGNNVIAENVGLGGIALESGASGNTIGGLTATPGTGAGNLVSGNATGGVVLNYAGSNNLVAGNLIGTDVTGTVALGNLFDTPALYGGYGVDLNYSPDNTVGEPGGRNVISGNGPGSPGTTNGANVIVYYSSGSAVQSNFIGTDITGTVALSTNTYNMYVGGGSSITIGGLTPTPGTGLGNVISGNSAEFGLGIQAVTGPVVVEGNIIGADATGEHELPNVVSGVFLNQASGVTIGGTAAGAENLISGDNRYGSEGNIFLSDSMDNAIEGNLIGTDITGEASLPALAGDQNGFGVRVTFGSTGNTIGGITAAARNIISGNTDDGVEITGSDTTGNLVAGNFVGTNLAGTAALGNGTNGVEIDTSASDNTIGGTTATARNVISGNSGFGVEIDTYATGNVVDGNYIGVDKTGDAALGNITGILITSADNTIGGTAAGSGNVIAGNDGSPSFYNGAQVLIGGLTALDAPDDNLVAGNSIGLDAAGATLAGATGSGVFLNDGVGNTIGGTTASAPTSFRET